MGRTHRFLIVAVFLCSFPAVADAQINWIRDYRAGIKRAQETKLPVMVDFWASWCGPCQQMDREVYNQPKLIEASKRFVFIQVDIDRDPGTAGQYAAQAIPLMVFIDPWENVLMKRQAFAYANDLLEMMKPIPGSFAPVSNNFEALNDNKENFEALMGIGAFYKQSGFPVIAKEFFGRALRTPRAKESPESRDTAQLALGLLALSTNDLGEARKLFEKACKDCDPKNEPFMLLGLGKTYFQMKKLKEARETFERVATRFPDTDHARIAKANLEKLATMR
ncbi:MAG TPA: thioredoxin family protein [Blastocatellia bacterium]|nr:thioredoxin family protein [Blastocatellia bacterium]